MSWVRFSIAVVLTSAALVVALFATGGLLAGNVLASGAQILQLHGGRFGPGGPGGWAMPPELASLKDVPANERFAHFKGVQANLTDKDGKPVAIAATPGVVRAVNSDSLTIAANDGATRTYSLNEQTMTRGKAVATGDNVVVVTIDNTSIARAVFGASPGDWGHNN
jgi:hypothetical protein